MIELNKEPISLAAEQKLRKWLKTSESDTLRKVIAARCQFLQASALGLALTANKGDSNDLLVQDDLRQAARYADFIIILDAIANTPPEEHFHVAKLKPTNAYANITERPDGET